MKQRAVVLAAVAATVAVAFRFFSSVRVQAFIRQHDDVLAMGFALVLGLIAATLALIGLLRIRRIVGVAGVLAVVTFAVAVVAFAPAKVIPVLTDEWSRWRQLAFPFAAGLSTLIWFLWIRHITGELEELDRSSWRMRRRTDDPGWRRTMLAEVAIAAVAVAVTIVATMSRLGTAGTAPGGAVWVFAPAVIALVAFAWMLDHGWAAWHREAQRPSER